MVGHGSLWPVLSSVLLVLLLVLGLPRRRIAGLATPVLFGMLAFVLQLHIIGSLPFLLQSKPAGFESPRLRNPSSGASPLWPAEEHPSNPCYTLIMGLSPIYAAMLVMGHAWNARGTGRRFPWAGLSDCGVVLHPSERLPRV